MEEASGALRQIDMYCERMDFTFWGEPLNAITNAAFLIAAMWMWYRISRRGAGNAGGIARALCVVLAMIGVGSFAWHTFATVWASALDTLSIGVFTLTYLFAANRHFWGLGPWGAGAATFAFLPYAAIVAPAFGQLPFFEISFFYWPLPLLILGYGLALWTRRPQTARGLVAGAGLLCVSLGFRSVDEMVCGSVPAGTHFMWHVLNGILLGWMIEVLRRDGMGAGARQPAS